MSYNNKTGKVTGIHTDSITIGGVVVWAFTEKAKLLVHNSGVHIGDDVEYNFRDFDMELIWIRVIKTRPIKIHHEVICNGEPEKDRIAGFYIGGGEMANMALASHDECDEFCDGDTI